jgi:hypothetical protein
VAVLADFRRVSLLSPEAVAAHLARRVGRRLDMPLPERAAGQDAMDWLDEVLEQAIERLGNSRLLIIIDEFDAELSREQAEAGQPAAILSLRSVLEQQRAMNWLFIVQDVFLADPLFGRAFPAVPHLSPHIGVGHLAEPMARQLIIKPALRQGFTYETDSPAGMPDIPDQIIAAAGGNPFLIHLICRLLIEHVARYGQTRITHADLNLVINQVLGRGTYLDHYTRHLEAGPCRVLVDYLVEQLAPGARLSVTALASALVGSPAAPTLQALDERLLFLEQVGIIDVMRDKAGHSIGIPVQLLHRQLLLARPAPAAPATPR